MPASATLFGSILGFGVQCYSNGVRKLPAMRHPWEHVIAAGAGGYFGSKVAEWEAATAEDIKNQMVAREESAKPAFSRYG